MHYININNTNK